MWSKRAPSPSWPTIRIWPRSSPSRTSAAGGAWPTTCSWRGGCARCASTSPSTFTAGPAAPGSPGPAGRPGEWATMCRAGRGCTRMSSHRPRELRARHSVENQWDLLAQVDPAFARPADPATDRVEMPADPLARAAIDLRLAGLGAARRRAHRGHSRERRQSVSALARDVVRGARERPGRGGPGSLGRARGRAVRSRGHVARAGAGAIAQPVAREVASSMERACRLRNCAP